MNNHQLEAYPDWIDPNVTAWMPLPEPFVTDTNVGNKKGAGR